MKKLLFFAACVFCTVHVAVASYVTDQQKITQDIIAQTKNKDYSPEDPLILVNPYRISPLTALIAFNTQTPTTVSVTIAGKDRRTTLHHEFQDKKTQHQIPVYGLYVGENEVTIEVDDGKKKKEYEYTILTENIPLKHTIDIIKSKPRKMKPGLTFVSPGVIVNPGSFAFAFDANGDIRWVLTDPIMGKMSPLHFLDNGTLILGSEEHDPKYTVAYHSLYEIDLFGRIRHVIKAEDDIQHDIVKLENGNYLALVNATGKPTIADTVVELTPDNKVVDRFDIDAILGVEKERLPKNIEHYSYKDNYHREKMDVMHLNSLNYDPEDDSIIMTARYYNFLLKVDRKTKQIKWILANPNNAWVSDKLREKLLKPTDKDFDYVYGAHAAKPHGNSRFTVLDNGLYRDIYDKGANAPIDDYNPSNSWSRGVEFQVNEKDMTVSVLWEYKRGPELYNHFLGDVDKFGKDHYLMNFGAVLDDKDETPNSVEQVLNPAKQTAVSYAKIIEVKNGKVIFEAQTQGLKNNTIYRAERVNPYSTNKEYKLD